jgi:phosphinothricin acetyltransferase
MVSYRAARLEDLAQIRTINTHYILNTSLTFVRTPPPFESYIAKLNDLTSRGLPYLVAVDDEQLTDDGNALVLGYASLSPFRPQMVSYAPTVELSLFVHPEYQSRAIGSVLLAHLLESIESGQVWHLCEGMGSQIESTVPIDEDVPAGAIRVRNVIAVMAVDPEGKDQGEALRTWYLKRGFGECGRMKKVGFKRGHW